MYHPVEAVCFIVVLCAFNPKCPNNPFVHMMYGLQMNNVFVIYFFFFVKWEKDFSIKFHHIAHHQNS